MPAPIVSQTNDHHQPAITRIVIRNQKFVASVPSSRCKPDEPVALVVLNRDNQAYGLKLTRFKNKNTNTNVPETDLFVTVPANPVHSIPAKGMVPVARTVKAAGNVTLATYEFFLELWDPAGNTTFYAELDPDFDITP